MSLQLKIFREVVINSLKVDMLLQMLKNLKTFCNLDNWEKEIQDNLLFHWKVRNQFKLDNQQVRLEQKKELENQFNDWKGSFEQVDDVLVIGIKM